jgi:hypothetical protein
LGNYVAEQYKYITVSSFPLNSNAIPGTADYKLLMNWVQGVKLSSISCSSGTVLFEDGVAREDLIDYTTANTFEDLVNTHAKALGAIKISNSNNTTCKKFIFSYDYFVDNVSYLPSQYTYSSNLTTDRKRLKLIQLQEQSCDGTVIVPPHTFEYFSELVTRRLCLGKDHWGFINGQNNNNTLIPTFTEEKTNGELTLVNGADRDARWPTMRAGTLKKINYPTGGYTALDFEANTTYLSFNQYNKVYINSVSVGYSGGIQSSNSIVVPASGNAFTLKLNNCNSGSIAYANGGVVTANPGTSAEGTIRPAAGNYTVTVSKSSSLTGCGAEVLVYEWQPTLIQRNEVVGGLRIKSIKQKDTIAGSQFTTNYQYNESNGQSSGYLYSRPTYVQMTRNDYLQQTGQIRFCSNNQIASCNSFEGCPLASCSGIPINSYWKSSSSLRPMNTTQGNHLGYNEVTITKTNNGSSVYRYYGSNLWDANRSDVAVRHTKVGICSLDIPNFPEAPPPHDFKRGELKYESHFNQAGQQLKEAWYYPEFVDNPVTTPAILSESRDGLAGMPTFYELKTARKTKVTINESFVSPTTGYATTTKELFYTSPYHHQLSKERFVTSTGDTNETKYTYAMDIRSSTCDAIADGYAAYTAAAAQCNSNYYSLLPSFCTSCNSIAKNEYCKYWKQIQRLKCLSVARINYVNNSKNYYNPLIAGSFTSCQNNFKSSADASLKPIVELQEEFNIAPIEISKWKNNQLLNATYYNYQIATNPVGKAYLNTVQQINLSAPSATFTPTTASGSTITKDSRYENESSINYTNGNITQLLPKNGVPIAYLWGYANQYPIATVSNASEVAIAYTSFEEGALGGFTIASTVRNAANAFTGKQTYTLTSGAISKTGLPAGKEYLLTYFTKNTSGATVLANGTVAIGGTLLFTTTNGWRCYQHVLPTTTTSVTISGTIIIDELRLHPKEAQMTSYTYTLLLGITSSNTNNSRINFFEYDALQRLKLVRDLDGNIVKKTDYQYQTINQ